MGEGIIIFERCGKKHMVHYTNLQYNTDCRAQQQQRGNDGEVAASATEVTLAPTTTSATATNTATTAALTQAEPTRQSPPTVGLRLQSTPLLRLLCLPPNLLWLLLSLLWLLRRLLRLVPRRLICRTTPSSRLDRA